MWSGISNEASVASTRTTSSEEESPPPQPASQSDDGRPRSRSPRLAARSSPPRLGPGIRAPSRSLEARQCIDDLRVKALPLLEVRPERPDDEPSSQAARPWPRPARDAAIRTLPRSHGGTENVRVQVHLRRRAPPAPQRLVPAREESGRTLRREPREDLGPGSLPESASGLLAPVDVPASPPRPRRRPAPPSVLRSRGPTSPPGRGRAHTARGG